MKHYLSHHPPKHFNFANGTTRIDDDDDEIICYKTYSS